MRNNNLLSKSEAERLLSFTNNSGPLFIVGTVGITLFGNSTVGYLLLVTHLLACFTVGIIFRFWKYSRNVYNYKSENIINSNFNIKTKTNPIYSSISNSIKTILLIGGFVVLFSVILSILNNSRIIHLLASLLTPIFTVLNIDSTFCHSCVTGFIELTNGVNEISNIPCKSISTNIILCSFLLGFAGICVLLQVYSIISNSDISIKPYILGKLLHGTFAAIYTYLIIKNVSFFNLDLQPVFLNTISKKTDTLYNYFENYNIFILSIIIIFTIVILKKYSTLKKKTIKN